MKKVFVNLVSAVAFMALIAVHARAQAQVNPGSPGTIRANGVAIEFVAGNFQPIDAATAQGIARSGVVKKLTAFAATRGLNGGTGALVPSKGWMVSGTLRGAGGHTFSTPVTVTLMPIQSGGSAAILEVLTAGAPTYHLLQEYNVTEAGSPTLLEYDLDRNGNAFETKGSKGTGVLQPSRRLADALGNGTSLHSSAISIGEYVRNLVQTNRLVLTGVAAFGAHTLTTEQTEQNQNYARSLRAAPATSNTSTVDNALTTALNKLLTALVDLLTKLLEKLGAWIGL